MEVQFTPEQEARILRLADYNGTPAEQLVRQAALRLVEEDERFRVDIDEALEQADRGHLIDHEEVKARYCSVFAVSMIVRWTEKAFLSLEQISHHREGTRELVLAPLPYIVVYRVKESTIEILQIRLGAQSAN